MMVCPRCNTKLKETSIVIWGYGGNVKVIGRQKFCPSMSCTYEGKIMEALKNGNN